MGDRAIAMVAPHVTAGHSYTLTLTNHDDNYAGDPPTRSSTTSP